MFISVRYLTAVIWFDPLLRNHQIAHARFSYHLVATLLCPGFTFSICYKFSYLYFNLNNSLIQVNQVILAKKRRLSQTDSGKLRKPATQAMVVTTPTTGSDSRQEVVVNGDDGHTPTEVANDDSSQTKDDAFYSRPPSVGSSNSTSTEITSPLESEQPSCSGNNMYAK